MTDPGHAALPSNRRDGSFDHIDQIEHVTVLEFNEQAKDHVSYADAGERLIQAGHYPRMSVRTDTEGFVDVAEAIAIIELPGPLDEAEYEAWIESEAGQLALAHFLDVLEPEKILES